jgi:hypothetical protein
MRIRGLVSSSKTGVWYFYLEEHQPGGLTGTGLAGRQLSGKA